MTEHAAQIVIDLIDAWNAHDSTRVAQHYAPEYVAIDVAYSKPLLGQQGGSHLMQRYVAAFPDLYISRDHMLAHGAQVALFWTFHGTHRGAFMNIPSTGRRIAVRGTSLFAVAAGQVVQGLHIWDVAGLLRTVGLLPDLP
ncbi:MAG: ester cyclase [Chloroflexaceae bacterium]|nr:ester cyclase [Chloroflexaceae bacterium]